MAASRVTLLYYFLLYWWIAAQRRNYSKGLVVQLLSQMVEKCGGWKWVHAFSTSSLLPSVCLLYLEICIISNI